MKTTDIEKPNRQYLLRTALFMGPYVAINIAAITGAFDDAKGIGAWILGLAVSAPVVGHIWAFLAYMRDSDEYVRSLMSRRFILASGIAMAICSTWGFLEIYAGARHLPGSLIVPIYWGAFGIVSPFIRISR